MASYPPFQQPITARAGQVDNSAWRLFFVRLGTLLSGAVTHSTGDLTDSHIVLGNGGGDIRVLTSLGTATTVLHGNAGGDPSFSAVNLTSGADVTGDLPYANIVQATAASRLLGRGSAAGAGDWQEITLGSGMSMSGTTLSTTASTNADLTASFLLMGG